MSQKVGNIDVNPYVCPICNKEIQLGEQISYEEFPSVYVLMETNTREHHCAGCHNPKKHKGEWYVNKLSPSRVTYAKDLKFMMKLGRNKQEGKSCMEDIADHYCGKNDK